jgi:hypothetical protein
MYHNCRMYSYTRPQVREKTKYMFSHTRDGQSRGTMTHPGAKRQEVFDGSGETGGGHWSSVLFGLSNLARAYVEGG